MGTILFTFSICGLIGVLSEKLSLAKLVLKIENRFQFMNILNISCPQFKVFNRNGKFGGRRIDLCFHGTLFQKRCKLVFVKNLKKYVLIKSMN